MGVCVYTFVLNNADNRLEASVNGSTICNSGYHDGDPNLSIRVEFTDLLFDPPNLNNLVIKGWNGETTVHPNSPGGNNPINPWHFDYHVEEKNTQTGSVIIIVNNNVSGDGPKTVAPGYLAGTWQHQIEKK